MEVFLFYRKLNTEEENKTTSYTVYDVYCIKWMWENSKQCSFIPGVD